MANGDLPIEYSVQFLSPIPPAHSKPNTIPMKYLSIEDLLSRATNHHGKRYPSIFRTNAIVENHRTIRYKFLHLIFSIYI